MQNCKPMSTPFPSYFRLSLGLSPETEEENEHISCVLYASVVESIIYVMVYPCLDIWHVVSMVNKFMGNLNKVH